MAIYKICDPPPNVATQSLVDTDYWNYETATNTGLFLYAKYPTKVNTLFSL
jgi:hypothetical protein